MKDTPVPISRVDTTPRTLPVASDRHLVDARTNEQREADGPARADDGDQLEPGVTGGPITDVLA